MQGDGDSLEAQGWLGGRAHAAAEGQALDGVPPQRGHVAVAQRGGPLRLGEGGGPTYLLL